MSEMNERGRAAVEALPPSIRVGAHDIGIVKWTQQEANARESWGEFSKFEMVIRIQIDMPTPSKAVDILLHELLHAICWAYAIATEDDEERTVIVSAAALTCIFRDNPWLGSWIDDALNPEHDDGR